MDHCDGLWVKPASADIVKDFNDQLSALTQDLSGNIDRMLKPLIEQVGQEIKDAAIEAAKDKGIKMGARAGGRWVVGAGGAAAGGVGAIVTEAVATAWNIVDLLGTGYDAGKLALESRAAINEMKALLDIARKAQQELEQLMANRASMSPTDLMGNAMGVLSRLNPCTRARRCSLVPYRNTNTTMSLKGHGCCPGQTGHHVIPEEAVGSCVGYSHGAAPTICVEGTTNANGTHGKVHEDMARQIEDYKKPGFLGGEKNTITYGKIRDIGIESVVKTFPESKCDKKCLRAQLDAYYKEKCKKPMKPAAGVAGGSRPQTDSDK